MNYENLSDEKAFLKAYYEFEDKKKFSDLIEAKKLEQALLREEKEEEENKK